MFASSPHPCLLYVFVKQTLKSLSLVSFSNNPSRLFRDLFSKHQHFSRMYIISFFPAVMTEDRAQALVISRTTKDITHSFLHKCSGEKGWRHFSLSEDASGTWCSQQIFSLGSMAEQKEARWGDSKQEHFLLSLLARQLRRLTCVTRRHEGCSCSSLKQDVHPVLVQRLPTGMIQVGYTKDPLKAKSFRMVYTELTNPETQHSLLLCMGAERGCASIAVG